MQFKSCIFVANLIRGNEHIIIVLEKQLLNKCVNFVSDLGIKLY